MSFTDHIIYKINIYILMLCCRGGPPMKRSQSPVRGERGRGRGRGYGSYPSYERTIGLDDDFEVVGRSKDDRGNARGGMRAGRMSIFYCLK